MAEPTDDVADNTAVDRAMFVTDEALGSTVLPPYLNMMWESEEYALPADHGIGVGAVRVHAGPDDGVSLSVHLEDKETGFTCGAHVTLERGEALALADAVEETSEATHGND